MIKLLGQLPEKLILACSGGPDSMAALDFLTRDGKRRVAVAYFNHGTVHGEHAGAFLRDYCENHSNVYFYGGSLTKKYDISLSMEEFWRNERYDFLTTLAQKCGWGEAEKHKVITCHHLDDQVEQYLFSMLNGKERLIPYSGWDGRVIRPFLLTRKDTMVEWCERHKVPYLNDPSNLDTSYRRNFIRHELLPKALVVNPGLHKVVKKKTGEDYLRLNPEDRLDFVTLAK